MTKYRWGPWKKFWDFCANFVMPLLTVVHCTKLPSSWEHCRGCSWLPLPSSDIAFVLWQLQGMLWLLPAPNKAADVVSYTADRNTTHVDLCLCTCRACANATANRVQSSPQGNFTFSASSVMQCYTIYIYICMCNVSVMLIRICIKLYRQH